jgi:hypothetical protein
MRNSVPKTALPGRSWSSHDALARGLGYFSIALGVLEVVAPRALCRAIGLDGHETVVRTYGFREIGNGVAVLASHDATPWIWGRVAGDGLDIATVMSGSRDGVSGNGNTALALTALLGVTALDVICATGLTKEKGSRRTARSDYRDRSGFPKGVRTSRGAARDFQTPPEFRAPEPLRPEVFERSRRRAGQVASASASSN